MSTARRRKFCGVCDERRHENTVRRHENDHLRRMGLPCATEMEREASVKEARRRWRAAGIEAETLVEEPGPHDIATGHASTDVLLNDADRRKTHGDFVEHSVVAQSLKETMRLASGWDELVPNMREALEMVQHKVARILVGDASTIDHWADIAGYAGLVADRLRKEAK